MQFEQMTTPPDVEAPRALAQRPQSEQVAHAESALRHAEDDAERMSSLDARAQTRALVGIGYALLALADRQKEPA